MRITHLTTMLCGAVLAGLLLGGAALACQQTCAKFECTGVAGVKRHCGDAPAVGEPCPGHRGEKVTWSEQTTHTCTDDSECNDI